MKEREVLAFLREYFITQNVLLSRADLLLWPYTLQGCLNSTEKIIEMQFQSQKIEA